MKSGQNCLSIHGNWVYCHALQRQNVPAPSSSPSPVMEAVSHHWSGTARSGRIGCPSGGNPTRAPTSSPAGKSLRPGEGLSRVPRYFSCQASPCLRTATYLPLFNATASRSLGLANSLLLAAAHYHTGGNVTCAAGAQEYHRHRHDRRTSFRPADKYTGRRLVLEDREKSTTTSGRRRERHEEADARQESGCSKRASYSQGLFIL